MFLTLANNYLLLLQICGWLHMQTKCHKIKMHEVAVPHLSRYTTSLLHIL